MILEWSKCGRFLYNNCNIANTGVDENRLPILVSHLFCYFFSMTAGLTPPVATVSYTAAGISGGSQTRTALMGLQLGITGFIIPFVFAYEEGLLLYGPFIHNIVPILTALVGLVLITCGFRGWLLVELRKAERLLLP